MAENIGFGHLPRGAKVLWEHVEESLTFSLGFFFATGSRYDPPGKAGTAHFVEHLVFKGTRGYSAAQLARLVDRVGGDLNAWTDREEVAFTCTVPADSWSVAVEALSELCFHPQFPEEEFGREKEVIRNEILASLEDPEDVSYEAFLQGSFPGEWSRPVAGTEASLASITLDDVRRWWATYGVPGELTVAFSGGVDPSIVQNAIAVRVEDNPGGMSLLPSPRGPRFVSRRWVEKSDTQMVQVVGGFSFPAPRTAREAAVWQIFSMLWGETMSSRLFQSIRELRGLCYSVTSQVFDSDALWGLQFFSTCAPENLSPLLQEFASEVGRLTSEPPADREWDDARRALRGAVILGSEKTENRVGRLWHQFENFQTPLGTPAALALLETPVTAFEAQEVLQVLQGQRPSLLVWGKIPKRFALMPPWDA